MDSRVSVLNHRRVTINVRLFCFSEFLLKNSLFISKNKLKTIFPSASSRSILHFGSYSIWITESVLTVLRRNFLVDRYHRIRSDSLCGIDNATSHCVQNLDSKKLRTDKCTPVYTPYPELFKAIARKSHEYIPRPLLRVWLFSSLWWMMILQCDGFALVFLTIEFRKGTNHHQ